MKEVTPEQLNEANQRRREQGRSPLTRDDANRALNSDTSGGDVIAILAAATAVASRPTDTSNEGSARDDGPSSIDPGAGDAGSGGGGSAD